jgi:anthranilate phosphoribosyltransferase
MIKQAIEKAINGRDLSRAESIDVMQSVMDGGATDAQIAALLTALRVKGESVDEITGFAMVMRQKAAVIKTKHKDVLDTCGTGGDKAGTFNISTTAAFVAAGAGIPVAKHGNRSVSSKCGSADVLEALGVAIELDAAHVSEELDTVDIGFMFAPLMHSAMKHVMPARREMGTRTVFNLLGPLTNPAAASVQVVGVYDSSLTEVVASVLRNLGTKRAFVVHGEDGLDEMTTTGRTVVSELRGENISTYMIEPEELSVSKADSSELKGGDAARNASILKDILRGKKGPKRDIVLLNAAAGICAADQAESLEEGIRIAAGSIDSGAAYAKLTELVEYSKQRN